ncbi:type VI secretion system baseplate subunit TssE [Maridesulfovibrio hydrothermalis]|uniref:Type VI secretion system lysozyme-related protein n=1 Tax=Maridesulfovibrio hydrothermalis AM13 = DSM 14728 TaxID=1121451 RepID=L0RD77_9BACT|nr:type VI secretion system baseplate subunit TssE [Maridesulfovibrio hydrothermalis]CCO24155.1 Type VI secretion system lysozyme-related protein [Maridesulfovibrio hydrothermalis AM13 = DSM 14728]
MNEQRLLERIRYMEQEPDSRDTAEPGQVVKSILDYLRMILNTRQGNAQIAPDFGVPDFTSMIGSTGLDAVRDIEESMTEVILKYEPRLENVKIEFIPEEDMPLSLQFKLQAKLALDDQEVPVVFETVLDPDGRIMVLDS